jgi:predicted SAM-dependent methyltransferase
MATILENWQMAIITDIEKESMSKIHIGCGVNYLDGWINCDINGKYDVYWDLMADNPFQKNSAKFIFMEHVLEHFKMHDGIRICSNVYATLEVGGVFRVSVPSLLSLINGYLNDPNYIKIYNKNFPNKKIRFKAQLFNSLFYEFGHKNIYDEQLLRFVLIRAGFKYHKIKIKKIGSGVFEKIERRVYKDNSSVESLVFEATK